MQELLCILMPTPLCTDCFFSQDDLNNLLYGLASRFYGISQLHKHQKEAVMASLRGRDCIIVQPTGHGKSLCYQLIALQSKKLAFVFTHTIALMYDQVQQLQSKGIASTVLDSEHNLIHLAAEFLHDDISQPSSMVVYLTAEHIYGELEECKKRAQKMEDLAKKGFIAVIAIDEVHLIFQWSHFR